MSDFHYSHQEKGTFQKAFGNVFGEGCAKMMLGWMGCGCGILVLGLVVVGGAVGMGYLLLANAGKWPTGSVVITGPIKPSPTTVGSTEPKLGRVVVRTQSPLLPDVTAFIEVDGKRTAEWPHDAKEVSLMVRAGVHRVVLRSKQGKNYYKKEFSTTVPDDGVVDLLVGNVDPDPDGRW
jgi:hypothetical protein